MADIKRKVLINRHTSGSSAPSADTMYLGEIAVAHGTGKETLFTKNNANEMVPFISCGQTIDIINSKIAAANVSYDVKAKEEETFIKAERGTVGSAVTFTLSSEDIQSKKAFDAYSSKTTNALDTLTKSFSDLLDVTLTAGTGDDIIAVSTVGTGTDASANTFSVTHAKAPKAITADFNKLATDKYGHVTAATAVEANDIEGLGFKNSAWTEEKITSAVEALDVTDAAVNGQYVSSVSETNGKISVSRADISKAPLNDYAKGSDASAVAAADSINVAISKLENQVDAAKASVDEKINGLDVSEVSETGKAIVSISQTDGKISAVTGDIAAAHVTVADTSDKLTATTVEGALAELADKAKAITITNTDGSINVNSKNDGTVIDVNINSDEKVLAKDGNGGLYTTLDFTKITTGLPATVKERYRLQGINGEVVGENYIDIPKDSHIKSINYITDSGDPHYQNLEYTYIDADGKDQTVYVDMSSLVLEAEFKSGVTADASGIVHGVVNNASEGFLTVGADGFKLSGVQAAIDAAKASATTKVAKDAAASHLTLESSTGADGSVTYTIGESDIASKTALDAEIAARKAVDGQNGQTYVANAGTNYISAATSLNDADIKLDTAIKAVSDKVDTAIAGLDSNSATTDSGHYITAITITDGKISAVGQSDKVNSASTAAHADAAKHVDSALTFSDVAGTNFEYNGSNAKSITFGKTVTGVGSSMSMDTNGVVDVEIIDCGTY